MIRTFHPVGQGAFYTEEFNDFSVVYDCGSFKNQALIEMEISSTFKEGQPVDAVFISHLDSDHVNGLEYLLKYCAVKKLFLPLLQDNEKIAFLIHNEILNGTISPFLRRLIESQEIVNSDTSVIRVPEIEQESEFQVDNELGSSYFDGTISTESLRRNPRLKIRNLNDWVFIPFNFKNSERSNALINNLPPGINIHDFPSFKECWLDKNKKRKIIKAYKDIPGNLNTNSMTLYSVPEKIYGHMRRYWLHSHQSYWGFGSHLLGCLYFGDYDAKGPIKWKYFIKHYQEYWDFVGTVQIPHHGSNYNYNREINKDNPKISIISSGNKNQFRHPHASTLKEILLDRGYPQIVNEDTGSRIMQEIIGLR